MGKVPLPVKHITLGLIKTHLDVPNRTDFALKKV